MRAAMAAGSSGVPAKRAPVNTRSPRGGGGALAVAEAHVVMAEDDRLSCPRDGVGLHQHLVGLAAVAAGVHHQGPAHRSGHGRDRTPAPQCPPWRPRAPAPRRARRRRRRGDGPRAPRPWRTPAPGGWPRPSTPPSRTSRRTSRLEPTPSGRTGDRRVEALEEPRKVVLVLWDEQHVRRPADAEPGVGCERRVALDLAPDGRQPVPPIPPHFRHPRREAASESPPSAPSSPRKAAGSWCISWWAW